MTDPNHGERAHARFSPSASDRWMACPPSIRLSEGLPDSGNTVYTVKGTICHEQSEKFLLNHQLPEADQNAVAKPYLDEAGVERMVIMPHEEWQPHVINYVYGIRELIEAAEMVADDKVQMIVEKPVDIEGPDCYGTPDTVIVYTVEGAPYIHCCDLKAGQKVVGPEAAQFKTYLVGLMKKHAKSKELAKQGRYYAHVFQVANEDEPRSQCCYTFDDLDAHRKAIRKAIKSVDQVDPGPVGDHCFWCPAKKHGTCPAQRDRAISVLDDLEEPKLPAVEGLSHAEKLGILEHADEISKWFDEIRESITAELLDDPESYEGWKVIEGRATRKWNPELEPEEIADALEMMDVEPWEKKLISFTVAEKALKKAKANVDHLVVKPPGKPKLVPATAKGEPLRKNLGVLDGD